MLALIAVKNQKASPAITTTTSHFGIRPRAIRTAAPTTIASARSGRPQSSELTGASALEEVSPNSDETAAA